MHTNPRSPSTPPDTRGCDTSAYVLPHTTGDRQPRARVTESARGNDGDQVLSKRLSGQKKKRENQLFFFVVRDHSRARPANGMHPPQAPPRARSILPRPASATTHDTEDFKTLSPAALSVSWCAPPRSTISPLLCVAAAVFGSAGTQRANQFIFFSDWRVAESHIPHPKLNTDNWRMRTAPGTIPKRLPKDRGRRPR